MRRLRQGGRALAGLALASFILAGCGEESSPAPTQEDGSDPASAPSKREFLDRADEICFSIDAQIEAVGDDLLIGLKPDERPSDAALRRFSRGTVAPKLREEVELIAALPQPEGGERQIEKILAATERAADQIDRDPRPGFEPPPALREAGRLASDYGSLQCGVR